MDELIETGRSFIGPQSIGRCIGKYRQPYLVLKSLFLKSELSDTRRYAYRHVSRRIGYRYAALRAVSVICRLQPKQAGPNSASIIALRSIVLAK
jgi:hypothetical protein